MNLDLVLRFVDAADDPVGAAGQFRSLRAKASALFQLGAYLAAV